MGEVATASSERPWERRELVSYQLHENGLSVAFQIHDPQDDEVEVTGFVKWDGCVNWSTSDNCMYHFCGKEHLVHFAQMMYAAILIAEEVMGDKVDPCFRSGWR